MRESLYLLTDVIIIDILIGFGLYSILYVSIAAFKNDFKLLETIDQRATRFIVFAGIIYAFSVFILAILYFVDSADRDPEPRIYHWAPWIQSSLWIVLTQLFRIKKVDIKLLRVVIAIVLIISFERFVIIVTSLHRDYLPGTWVMFRWFTPSELIFGITVKVTLFCLMASVYAFIADRIKTVSIFK